jgi:SAM-dependent methyltransferase
MTFDTDAAEANGVPSTAPLIGAGHAMEPVPSFTALRCVACGSPGLEPGPDRLDCANCHRSYPVVADVPVMFGDVVLVRGPLLAPAVVRTVLRAMDVPADTGLALRVRRASGAQARYGDQLVAAGSAQFLRRVHASGYPIPTELLKGPEPALATDPDQADARCRWVADYIPRAMKPGHAMLANIRFENTGTAPMRHQGVGRVNIAFTWADMTGETVPTEDYRTPLPVDLAPGLALTLPIRLVPPAAPGRYTLVLRMVMEGVRWLEPEYGPLRIQVRADAGFVPPAHWRLHDVPPTDYVADHDRGIAVLQDWLTRYPARPPLRMLEIGGNAKPALAHFAGERYNVDVDLLGLQVGAIVQPARQRQCASGATGPLSFICADAQHLPFADNFFDVIILFASLHHFPQPAAVLRRLRTHLRAGGFIGIFCEPIGHIWPGAVDQAYAAELEHGVNEQGFSLAEYAQIFAASGLRAADVEADYNSLKARLLPISERA